MQNRVSFVAAIIVGVAMFLGGLSFGMTLRPVHAGGATTIPGGIVCPSPTPTPPFPILRP